MMCAYDAHVHHWTISNPEQDLVSRQGIDAFIDDTTLLNASTQQHPQDSPSLITMTQNNLTLWNNLLETSGGALNPTKCIWGHFKWIEQNGQLILQNPAIPNKLQLTISRHGATPKTIPQTNPEQATRYLGVQIMIDGNWQKEFQILKKEMPNTLTFSSNITLTNVRPM